MIKKRTIAAAATVLMALQSCKPEPYGKIGDDYSLTEGITGTWELQTVLQTDETQPVPEVIDISDFFVSDPMVMSFDYATSSYTVDNPGAGGNIFGNSGSFAFDDLEFPSGLSVYTDLGDTLMMSLTQMVRSIDIRMGFRVSRQRCDELNISYDYDFNRQ